MWAWVSWARSVSGSGSGVSMSTTTKRARSRRGTPSDAPLSGGFTRTGKRPSLPLLGSLFLLTGSTALATQVVFSRLLTYVFGASHLATSTVLAAYMAGLSAGAFLSGRFARRLRRPVLVYGLIELSIACSFALVPWAFPAFRDLGIELGRSWAHQPLAVTGLRFVLSFAFVFVPTVLAGASLPTLLTAFRTSDAVERCLPPLYALNTLGGALGTFASGYWGIFLLGLDGTLRACAAVNATVGITSLLISRWVEPTEIDPPGFPHEDAGPATMTRSTTTLQDSWGLGPRTVCVMAFLQGALSFTLEVVWSHLIGTTIGVTTYAFVIMLTAVLLGIGVGSLLLPAVRRRLQVPSVTLFACSEMLMAAGLVASLFLWDRFPDVVAWTLDLWSQWSFAAREVVRFLFALSLLFPATLAMGLALPSLTAAVRHTGPEDTEPAGPWVGTVFGANTLGAIVGALTCGFVLLGRVGSSRILAGAALAAMLMAAGAMALARSADAVVDRAALRLRWLAPTALACALGIAAFPGWDPSRLTAGSHYYWQRWVPSGSQPLFAMEDAQSGFVTVERTRGFKAMKTNGKYEGSDAPLEFQDDFALIGSLYLNRFRRAALVGLGPGRTLALLHDMPFEHIEVIEFSRGIIEAARREFPSFVGPPFQDPGRVLLICDDGRNHLQLAAGGYDYIAIGASGAAFAGVGNLYTLDFFSMLRERLADKGVLLLWIQIHHVPTTEVRSVVYTLRRAFPHVHFYATERGDQGFLIASKASLEMSSETAERLAQGRRVRQYLEVHGMASLAELAAFNVFSTDEELAAYFRHSPSFPNPPLLFTDLAPSFEYATPFGLATMLFGYDFQPYSLKRLPAFQPPLSEGAEAGLLGLRYQVGHQPREAIEHFERSERLLGRPIWQQRIASLRPFVNQ